MGPLFITFWSNRTRGLLVSQGPWESKQYIYKPMTKTLLSPQLGMQFCHGPETWPGVTQFRTHKVAQADFLWRRLLWWLRSQSHTNREWRDWGMGTLEEQLHFLTYREVLLQMVGKGSNNNPHGWSVRPAARRSQKTYLELHTGQNFLILTQR